MVEIDQSFVLHLTIAAIASTEQSVILLRELDLMLRTVLAHRDATLITVVMFASKHSFDRSELFVTEGTCAVLGLDDFTRIMNQRKIIETCHRFKVGVNGRWLVRLPLTFLLTFKDLLAVGPRALYRTIDAGPELWNFIGLYQALMPTYVTAAVLLGPICSHR